MWPFNRKPKTEQKAFPEHQSGSVMRIGGSGTLSAEGRTAELLAAYRVSPWVRAVVAKIAYHVSSVPWVVYRAKGGARGLRTASPEYRRKAVDAGDLVEVPRHRLLDLMGSANPMMTGLTARKVAQIMLDLRGEALWIIERDGRKNPVEYWPIPPHWLCAVPEPGAPFFKIRMPGGNERTVSADDVIWFRDVSPENPYGRGVGTGQSLGDEIESDELAAKYIKGFFQNRAVPEMLIGVEGAGKDELERSKRRMAQNHRGPWRSHESFWHAGKIQVEQLSQSFEDMEISEFRQHERDVVISVYGVPPEIIGVIGNPNRATIAEARHIMASEVVIPRLEFMRTEKQERLVTQFEDGENLIVDYLDPSPDDKETKLKAMQAAPWAATRGEWREMQGLENRGGEDDLHYGVPGASPAPTEERAAPARVAKAPSDVERALEALRPERLREQLEPFWSEELGEWGTAELASIPGAAGSFDLLNPKIAEFVENFLGDEIKGINDTTKDALRSTLMDGIELGEGPQKLAARVGATFEQATGHRAMTIARTETVRAANWATTEAHRISGVVVQRQWINTADDRVREDHNDSSELGANGGQVVGIDEPFTSGGATAMYPGGFGVPELDINCRCTTAAVIGEPTKAVDTPAVWRAFEGKRESWEERARKALVRGFRAQLAEVLAAM
jgi:HK97 family phage portal protein